MKKNEERKDPIRESIDEQKKSVDLLKSSSKAAAATPPGRTGRKPAFPLDSFEASQVTREPDVTGEQMITIGELRRLLTSEIDTVNARDRDMSVEQLKDMLVPEVNAIGPGRGRKYSPQPYPPQRYPPLQYHRQSELPDQFNRGLRYPPPLPQPHYPFRPAGHDQAQTDPHLDHSSARQQQQQPPPYPSHTTRYQPQRAAVTCFACGEKGLRRPDCINPPLPVKDQRRMYESMFGRGYVGQPRSNHNERQYQSEEYTYPQNPSQSARYQEQPEQRSEQNRVVQANGAPHPPPPPHREATSDKPSVAPRIEPVAAVEELGLPRHSSDYSHVTFD